MPMNQKKAKLFEDLVIHSPITAEVGFFFWQQIHRRYPQTDAEIEAFDTWFRQVVISHADRLADDVIAAMDA